MIAFYALIFVKVIISLVYHTTMSGFHPQPSLRHAPRKRCSEKAMDKILLTE